jgi:Animal haem peroxidase
MVDPLKGSRYSPMTRIFGSGFEDGMQKPPQRNESSRNHSVIANAIKGTSSERVTDINSDMSTTIGQVWTHEFMKTKKSQLFKDKRGGGFNCCCSSKNLKLADLIRRNKYCMPIEVQNNDPCYQGNVNCLNYIKSIKSSNNCKLDSTPMPTNFHTPYIDAELIYNWLSSKHLSENGGKFDTNNIDKMKEILVGYDDRSSQLSVIFLYLNFFCKFHNLVFDELKKFKGSTMNDAAISFEARKITTAAYQKVFLDFIVNILRKFK